MTTETVNVRYAMMTWLYAQSTFIFALNVQKLYTQPSKK